MIAPDSEKLKKMRDRIESLRGLCKTAVGYLRDENAFDQAAEIAILIGDMEPTLNQTLESETASELRRLHEVNTELREKVAAIADWPRGKPAPAKPIENWYYLDEVLTLHQLGKWRGFDAAYAEMERVSRGCNFFRLVCEDQVKEWRAQLDRWLGDDNYSRKYKKRRGDL